MGTLIWDFDGMLGYRDGAWSDTLRTCTTLDGRQIMLPRERFVVRVQE